MPIFTGQKNAPKKSKAPEKITYKKEKKQKNQNNQIKKKIQKQDIDLAKTTQETWELSKKQWEQFTDLIEEPKPDKEEKPAQKIPCKTKKIDNLCIENVGESSKCFSPNRLPTCLEAEQMCEVNFTDGLDIWCHSMGNYKIYRCRTRENGRIFTGVDNDIHNRSGVKTKCVREI